MNRVFIDTSYLLALELANDQNHQIAINHWQGILHSLPKLVTTSYIFDEVVTFFNSRNHYKKAVQVGNMLLHSDSIQMIHVDEELFYAGWLYFQNHQDKCYSLTDCVSFVVMQRKNIEIAFSFDKHFAQAGFDKHPT